MDTRFTGSGLLCVGSCGIRGGADSHESYARAPGGREDHDRLRRSAGEDRGAGSGSSASQPHARRIAQASGSRGPAPGSPGLAVGRAGRAAAAEFRIARRHDGVAVAFTAAGTNDPLPGPGPEGRLRNNAVFNFLFVFTKTGQLVPSLATEATPNATATVWTIKLRSGVTFHDGSPLTADDVVYTFKRILDKKTKAQGYGDIGMVNAAGVRKIDPHRPRPSEVRILDLSVSAHERCSDHQERSNDLQSADRHRRVQVRERERPEIVLAKNPDYWEPNLPGLDGAEIVNIQDSTARLNALKTNQVDTIYPVDSTQIPVVSNSSNIKISVNKTGTYMPIYMRATAKPFTETARARRSSTPRTGSI